MYLLNHANHKKDSYGKAKKLRKMTDSDAGDHLYRNDGGKFTDVTNQAGIYSSVIGYGLGDVHRRFGNVPQLSKTKGELYNFKHDISEEKNLYKKYPKKVKQLKSLMKAIKEGKVTVPNIETKQIKFATILPR